MKNGRIVKIIKQIFIHIILSSAIIFNVIMVILMIKFNSKVHRFFVAEILEIFIEGNLENESLCRQCPAPDYYPNCHLICGIAFPKLRRFNKDLDYLWDCCCPCDWFKDKDKTITETIKAIKWLREE